MRELKGPRANPQAVVLLRLARGLTQQQLAQLAGVCESTIRNCEHGRTRNLYHLPKIARALEVPTEVISQIDLNDVIVRRRVVADLYRQGLNVAQIAHHLGMQRRKVNADLRAATDTRTTKITTAEALS